MLYPFSSKIVASCVAVFYHLSSFDLLQLSICHHLGLPDAMSVPLLLYFELSSKLSWVELSVLLFSRPLRYIDMKASFENTAE